MITTNSIKMHKKNPDQNPDYMDKTHSLRIETIRDLFCPARESKTRMHGLKKKNEHEKKCT